MRRERTILLQHRLRALLALAVLACALLSAAPASAEEVPRLSLRLWITPANAARGDVVSYEILIDNVGGVGASRVRVELPFSEHMQIVRTEFDRPTTWISKLEDQRLTVMFGRLNRGEGRRAKIFFAIGPHAPDGLQWRVRATGRYEGDRGNRVHSNHTTLTINGEEANTEPQVTVAPDTVQMGGSIVFQVRNYFPKEQIFTWINAPNGDVLESNLAGRTDANGATDLHFSTRKLAPGAYTMVVYGNSSEITTVVPFVVTAEEAAQAP